MVISCCSSCLFTDALTELLKEAKRKVDKITQQEDWTDSIFTHPRKAKNNEKQNADQNLFKFLKYLEKEKNDLCDVTQFFGTEQVTSLDDTQLS